MGTQLCLIIYLLFQAVEKPFLFSVENALGRKYKGDIKKTYEKAVRFILGCFVHGFRQARRLANT